MVSLLDPERPIGSSPHIDWHMSEHLCCCIAAASRMDATALRPLDAGTAHPGWEQHWFSWSSFGRDIWHERDIFGDQLKWAWCKSCIQEGYKQHGQEFIQLQWTSAFTCVCHRHHTALTHRCECGAPGSAFHQAEKDRTRLLCSFCQRPVTEKRNGRIKTISTDDRKIDILMAFDEDFSRILSKKSSRWLWSGKATRAALTSVVDDLAYALCTRPSSSTFVPLDVFRDDIYSGQAFPALPDLEHKLGVLSPRWKLTAIGAIIIILGNADFIEATSAEHVALKRSLFGKPGQSHDSLEWLADNLSMHGICRLMERSTEWPPEIRKRLSRCNFAKQHARSAT